MPDTDDAFVRMVRRLAKWGSSRVIENASIKHALVIIECLLDEAKKRGEEVRIVSGCLMDSFYSDLTGKVMEVMDAGAPVLVAVLSKTEEELKDNAFCQAVKEHVKGEVHFVNEDEDLPTPHFVVTGAKRYRIEVDHEKKKAMACFNDPDNGRMLASIHKSLIRKEEAGAKLS